MELFVIAAVLAAPPIAGVVAAVTKAMDPDATTGRRIELSILAGLLALVALFVGLVAYCLWNFGRTFTF